MDLLSNRAISNPIRLGILISLFTMDHMNFSELTDYLNQHKSSVFNNLQVLEDEGLITVKKVPTLRGPRTLVRITDKGRDIVKEYIRLAKRIKGD